MPTWRPARPTWRATRRGRTRSSARKTESMTASARVQTEWLRRVEAEYRSAALTQHLGLWLTQIAASPDLVKDALRIAEDELVHAELSHAAYRAAGGAGAPRLDRDRLALPRRAGDPLELDVTRIGTEMF